MKQEIDVVTVFNRGESCPKPIKFRIIENGTKLTVDVYDVLNYDYIGSNIINYECNSISRRGNLLTYKLQYYRKESKWIIMFN